MHRIVFQRCSVWFHSFDFKILPEPIFPQRCQTDVLAGALSKASKPRHVVVETIVLLRRDRIKLIDP